MGYTHGIQWTEKKVLDAIKEVMEKLDIKRFPTKSEMISYYHNSSLADKVSKSGGVKYWVNKLGLGTKECESKTGEKFENYCLAHLTSLGYDVETMQARYPYDLLANDNIKIDVKSGYIFENNGLSPYYSFNLEKKNPTCDIFVVYCLNKDGSINKTYVIPSVFLSGKTQLSLGIGTSKYDKFRDAWHYIEKYNDFYKNL